MPEQAVFLAQQDRRARHSKAVVPLLISLLLPCSLLASYEGFGSTTQAGNQGKVVEVTSLEDSGPGTLRESMRKGDTPRRIVFRVSGAINLQRPLKIKEQSFITIDGSTAPGSGITLEGNALYIQNSHDVIVTHMRVRHSKIDGLTIRGSHNIVIDHCSFTDSGDENIGLTQDCHDVTVSWCIIGDTRPVAELRPKGMLIANFDKPAVTNVSLHHNLFTHESQRSPQVSTVGLFDIRNNVIGHWQSYGIRMRRGARGNIVNNVFKTETNVRRAILLTENPGPVYIGGNQGPGDFDVNRLSTASTPFAVAAVSTDPVAEVEQQVLQKAGAFPRDAVDRALVSRTSPTPTDRQQDARSIPDQPQQSGKEDTAVSKPAEENLEGSDNPAQEGAP
jgi:pectate lyase